MLFRSPVRLRQIALNLVSNAIKFTSEGQVVLRVSSSQVEPDWLQLHFSVRDTGIGMDAAAVATLFTPFTQADSSTTRRFGGTGLGLSICKRLVEAMGGQIDVSSEVGTGTTFSGAECAFNSVTGIDLGWADRLRCTRVLGPPAVALHCLLGKGLIFDGKAGLLYTAQRITADLILSMHLLRRDLDRLVPGKTSR